MNPSNPLPSICMVVNGLDIGKRHGGAERFASELCLKVREAGFPASIALLDYTGNPVEQAWKERLEQAGVRVVHPNTGAHRSLTEGLKMIKTVCQEEKVGILHSHCKIGSLIAVALRRTGQVKRAIQTVHAGQEWGWGFQPWLLRQVFSQWVFGMMLDAQVGVSLPISERLRKSPGAVLSHQKVAYITNAIPDNWFAQPTSWPRSGVTDLASPIISVVGVLQAKKGHKTLIEAAAIAAKQIPGLKLWIIGEGPEMPRLKEVAHDLAVESGVIFWGPQLPEQVQNLLDQTDLFVFPSLSEGLPTVLLESMARGIPVIASDIPGNRELVENGVTGWLVLPQDADGLASAIRFAFSNPEKTCLLAKQAYQNVQKFRFSVIAPQYLKLYQDLVLVS